MVFDLELYLNANDAHNKVYLSEVYTSGGDVIMCVSTLRIVFPLDADMRYALVYGNGVWPFIEEC